jgi:hypothetical protein
MLRSLAENMMSQLSCFMWHEVILGFLLTQVAHVALKAAYLNCGQNCAGGERFFVHTKASVPLFRCLLHAGMFGGWIGYYGLSGQSAWHNTQLQGKAT